MKMISPKAKMKDKLLKNREKTLKRTQMNNTIMIK